MKFYTMALALLAGTASAQDTMDGYEWKATHKMEVWKDHETAPGVFRTGQIKLYYHDSQPRLAVTQALRRIGWEHGAWDSFNEYGNLQAPHYSKCPWTTNPVGYMICEPDEVDDGDFIRLTGCSKSGVDYDGIYQVDLNGWVHSSAQGSYLGMKTTPTSALAQGASWGPETYGSGYVDFPLGCTAEVIIKQPFLYLTGRQEYCSGDNIQDVNQCQAAAAQLGLSWAGSFHGPSDHQNCLFADDTRQLVYWNTAGDAAASSPPNAKYKSICGEPDLVRDTDSLVHECGDDEKASTYGPGGGGHSDQECKDLCRGLDDCNYAAVSHTGYCHLYTTCVGPSITSHSVWKMYRKMSAPAATAMPATDQPTAAPTAAPTTAADVSANALSGAAGADFQILVDNNDIYKCKDGICHVNTLGARQMWKSVSSPKGTPASDVVVTSDGQFDISGSGIVFNQGGKYRYTWPFECQCS